MEDVAVTTGVESVPAAGGQETGSSEDSFDLESLLFGDQSEEGAKEEDAAGPAEGTEQGESQDQGLPDDASKAFAKKWAAESEKLEEKIRTKVMAELEAKTRTTPQEQAQGAPAHRELSQTEIDELAQKLDVSSEAARIFYKQQELINNLTEEQRRNTQRSREQAAYNDAVQYARQLKEQNPAMPDWSDEKIQERRMEHWKVYGTTLPWKEAYKMQLADSVLSGDLTRQAQQDAIRNIQTRETAAVGLKAPASQKKTINDLSTAQFNQMVEDAKMGKFKKS
jgi:hypothetical protein